MSKRFAGDPRHAGAASSPADAACPSGSPHPRYPPSDIFRTNLRRQFRAETEGSPGSLRRICKKSPASSPRVGGKAESRPNISRPRPPSCFWAWFQPAIILWLMSKGAFDVIRHTERAWRLYREMLRKDDHRTCSRVGSGTRNRETKSTATKKEHNYVTE